MGETPIPFPKELVPFQPNENSSYDDRGLRFGRLRRLLDGRADLDGSAEALVVVITHSQMDTHVAGAEVQGVVGTRVGREPEVALNVFAEIFESREYVFAMFRLDVRNGFAVGLDDAEIPVFDPNATLEIALFLFDAFGGDIKNVGVQFVELLPADVFDVVLGELFGGKNKRLDVLDVVDVLLGHAYALEGICRSLDDVFRALAFGIEGDVTCHAVFAVGLAIVVDGLHHDCLRIDELFPLASEFVFTRSEFRDDLVFGNGERLVSDFSSHVAAGWGGSDHRRRFCGLDRGSGWGRRKGALFLSSGGDREAKTGGKEDGQGEGGRAKVLPHRQTNG